MNKKYLSALPLCVFIAIVFLFIGYETPHSGMKLATVSPAVPARPNPSSMPNSSASASAPADSVVIPVSIVTVQEDASTSPQISIEYPQFASLPADFNAEIASAVTDRLGQFQKDVASSETARAATGGGAGQIPPSAYSFIATWQESQINPRYVSFIIRFDSFAGGANDDQEIQTFNYDVAGNKMMALQDLFPNDPNYLKTVSTEAKAQLSDSLTQASPGYDPTAMLDAGTAPTADNFQYFTFTDYDITLYFPKYAVAPGSFGEQRATIPRSSTP